MKTSGAGNIRAIIVQELSGKKQLPAGNKQYYFTHILCHNGSAAFTIQGKAYRLAKNDIVIGLPGVGISQLQCTGNFKASCLLVSFDLMSKNNPDTGWGIKGYLFSKENPVVKLTETDAAKCVYNFRLLKEKYADVGHRFHKEITGLQVQMFVMDMWNIFSKEMERRRVSNQEGSLFERFLLLVEEHCMQEREVAFYAAKLFITAKYLTEICKKASGKTASGWIHNHTTQRLQMLLQNKELSLGQVADTLNFSSMSFFSRYVRKMLGVSPAEYRRK